MPNSLCDDQKGFLFHEVASGLDVFLVQSSNRPLEKLSWLGEWNPAAHWSSSNHRPYSCAETWHKTNLSLWLLDPCMLKSHFRKYFSQLCIHPVQPRQQDAEGFGRKAITWFCCQTLDNGPEKKHCSRAGYSSWQSWDSLTPPCFEQLPVFICKLGGVCVCLCLRCVHGSMWASALPIVSQYV